MSQVFQELDRLSDLLKVHKVPAAEWQKTLHCGASSFVGRRYSSQANCTAVWRPDLFNFSTLLVFFRHGSACSSFPAGF